VKWRVREIEMMRCRKEINLEGTKLVQASRIHFRGQGILFIRFRSPCGELDALSPSANPSKFDRNTELLVLHIVIGDARARMAAGRQTLLWKSKVDVDGDSMLETSVRFTPSRPRSFTNSTTKPLNSQQAPRRVHRALASPSPPAIAV
jgi:hypothetical protein